MISNPLEILSSDWARQFVLDHEKDDLNQLLLNPPQQAQGHIKLLVNQISSRRKARKKLPSWYRTPHIIWPPPLSIEQASSEEAAAYKKDLVTGKRLVDLTGGMGVDCMALSKVFEETVYVECSEWLCTLLRHNAEVFGKSIEVHHGEAMEFLDGCDSSKLRDTTFYIDPARRTEHKKVVLLEQCEPDATRIIPHLVRRGATILLKTSPLLDIHSVLEQLPGILSVYVVAVRNEVKEVLYYFDGQADHEPGITAVNLESQDAPVTFHLHEELHAKPHFPSGDLGGFIYEPNAALLKAGAFKLLSDRYGIAKLARNTHLYSSSAPVPDFPGKVFELISIMDKKAMKSLAGRPLHVISRNHPMSVDAIREKYQLKEGGEDYLIAARVDQQPLLLYCRPLS